MPTILTNLGIFLGFLSLWTFVMGFSPFHLGRWQILLGAILVGSVLVIRKKKTNWRMPKLNFLELVMLVIILFSSWRILSYSIFYPFVTWDSLAIYGLAAKRIFMDSNLLSLSGHPPFLALSYANIFLLSGGASEQLAKVIPALLAVMTIGATYLLGKTIFNQKVGILSAFILSVTPLFKIWAGAGYADIPGTFFFLMAMVFFYKEEFILTGIFTGLAIWTKQSTLLLLISFPLAALLLRKTKLLLKLVPVFMAAFLTGGFWYIRNFWLTHEFFPAASDFWALAGRNIRNLSPFLNFTGDFGYWLSPLFASSFLLTVLRVKRKEFLYLLSFVLPYFLIWWYFYSYETRFLLTILPIFTVFAAVFIDEVWYLFKKDLFLPKVAGLILILGVSASTLYASLSFDLIKKRNLNLEQKREEQLGPAYSSFKFLMDMEKNKNLSVVTSDSRLLYFLDKSTVSQTIPRNLTELKRYNYFLLSPWAEIISQREGWSFKKSEAGEKLNEFKKVFESGDYAVYKIKN